MKVISIGDIHGLKSWKNLMDIQKMLDIDGYIPLYDKYIFLGDYVDSYDISNTEIYDNLVDIINFKKKYPSHIILLLGNHDMQYIFGTRKCGCSGFRPEMVIDLHELFTSNLDLFLVAYQINDTIYSHAGITKSWFMNRVIEYMKGEYPFSKEISDLYNTESLISATLNILFKYEIDILFDVGYMRGGFYPTGGPTWADKNELIRDPLPNYNQIVGHTHVKDILEVPVLDNKYKLVFCDCLSKKTECYFKTF